MPDVRVSITVSQNVVGESELGFLIMAFKLTGKNHKRENTMSLLT